MSPVRHALAALLVVVGGLAILGVGQGDAPKSDPAPAGAALVASKARVANGSELVKEGEKEFRSEGCNRCHSMAASGYDGKIGPRLDTLADQNVAEIVTNIVKPRVDIVKGYPPNVMPADYAKRIKADEIKAIATYLKAASGSAKKSG